MLSEVDSSSRSRATSFVASRNAQFGFPEIRLATFPGWGGTQLAADRMGVARAKEMIWSGKYYTAEECASFGLISRLSHAEGLLANTLDFASLFVDKEPLCLSSQRN